MQVEFILYVADQQRSRDLYAFLLDRPPVLDVPGMTEFDLGSCKLGLMPEDSIARIITPALPHPTNASGVPRCELYLLLDDMTSYIARAEASSLRIVDPARDRDWRHRVAYFSDPDGHVIAFAQPIPA
ncbi:MAG: lactoylglutathione lyase [Flavobacteriales bacterium]|nr:lactoylglutathione lyase [Flavobacteriales bacterium]MBP7407170.1 lactoylglutathione lyase [Flavobacteriales bacterium]